MNLDSCGGCHAQPAIGGSSPAVNPQVAFANLSGGTDAVPPFLSINGPVREARFVRNPDGTADGGVHALFTINGRPGSSTACAMKQPDFATQVANSNVIFRIANAGLRRRTDGADPGLVDRGEPGEQLVGEASARHPRPAELPRLRAAPSPARPTTTATTARSRASAGRRRTSRCSSSRARPTTSRWASRTSCS